MSRDDAPNFRKTEIVKSCESCKHCRYRTFTDCDKYDLCDEDRPAGWVCDDWESDQ